MSSLTRIEKNVVMPELGAGRRWKYPWHQLNPSCGNPPRGDSFLVECPDVEVSRLWNTLTSCKNNITRRYGKVFATRRVPGGIRVWRLK